MPLNAALYAVRKKAGLCTKCAERALPHRPVCQRCLEKLRKADVNRREKRRKFKRRFDRERHERLNSEGRCTQCGQPNPEPDLNSRVCPACNVTMKASKRNWKRKQVLELLVAEESDLQQRLIKLQARRLKLDSGQK
jgi:hypothetical protein